MLFLSPLFLWCLAAAALPVVIHLINRRRHQTVQWAAMQFLLKASRQSRGKRKLRNILILACRCLIIGGLVAAAARPVVSGLMGWGGGSIDTVVLVLDRSASMEIKPADGLESRREILLGKVRETMASLGNPRLVLIDSATGSPLEVASPEVLADLSAAAATETAADIPALVNRAAEFLAEVPGNSEIWLASDLQASNWKANDEAWATVRASLTAMVKEPRLRVLSLTGSTAANASVSLLGAARAGNELLLEIEVTRHDKGRGGMAIPLTTTLGGVATTESLTVVEQSLVFQKVLRLEDQAATGFGWLSIPGDGNLCDNVAFFAYGPDRDKQVLVVAPPGESADFLGLAAAPPGIDGLSVKTVAAEVASSELSPDLAAVLWAAPLPTGALADELLRFLKTGGHVMFLAPGQASSTSFLDVKWSPPQQADAGKYFILGDWNRRDGLMRDGLGGTPVAGARLKAIQRQLVDGDLNALATWEDGEPALARKVVDAGTAWFLGSIPDYTWSNLGDADVLLPAVQRMITAGAARFDQANQAELGMSTRQRLGTGGMRRVDHYHTAADPQDGTRAGVYDLGDQCLAVNRPAREDDPEILTQDQLRLVFDGLRFSQLEQDGQADDAALTRDAWRAFLTAALLFLLAEAMLCLPKQSPVVVLPAQSPS